MKLHIRLLLFFGLLLSLLAKGSDEEAVDFMEIIGNVEESIAAREDRGELQMLNLSHRKGTINGYTYLFGPVVDPIRVKMLGSEGGALELLAEGMYVRVAYFETQGYRIALRLEQIPVDPSLNH
ncbi:hypothetical protein N8993_07385 [Pseudomonadales bacterium]|nr:hypothetical protein [Pseudomonadales bacterium]